MALKTTRELVLKDFALEPDDRIVLKACLLIVENLAGSLALIFCRDPLNSNLRHNLEKAFEKFENLTSK